MNQLTVNGHTALDYAEMACKALMKKFAPQDPPPKGRLPTIAREFFSRECRKLICSAATRSIMSTARRGLTR